MRPARTKLTRNNRLTAFKGEGWKPPVCSLQETCEWEDTD